MSTPAERNEKALAYLEAVLDDPDAKAADKLVAAKAIVARDAREAGAAAPRAGGRRYRVLVPDDD